MAADPTDITDGETSGSGPRRPVVVDECNNPDHRHAAEYPIPAGGCPDPRQDADPPIVAPMARLNCQIPSFLDERVRKECNDRMIGVGLLVSKALEKFLDELPPAP